jgi:hypothetical protein
MKSYQRPKDKFLFVKKLKIQAVCPKCGSKNISRYPVLSENGWLEATKCQNCLFSLERKANPNRLGHVELISDFL